MILSRWFFSRQVGTSDEKLKSIIKVAWAEERKWVFSRT